MSNRNLEHLTGLAGARECRGRIFNLHRYILANKMQRLVPEHGPRQQPCFEQNLKPVADAEHHPTLLRKFLHRSHHRREPRDRASPQIVTVGKPAGQDNRIQAREQRLLVPDHLHILAQHILEDMLTVVIAITAGKNYHSDLHHPQPSCLTFYAVSSYRYSSMMVFANNFSHMAFTAASAFALSVSFTSTSIYFPTRTLPAFLNPSESSACSIAFPC